MTSDENLTNQLNKKPRLDTFVDESSIVDNSPAKPPVSNRFTSEEDKLIEEGVAKFGFNWPAIEQWSSLDRSAKQIKSRYERLLFNEFRRKSSSAETTPSHPKARPSSPQVRRIDQFFLPLKKSVAEAPKSDFELYATQIKIAELEKQHQVHVEEIDNLLKENHQMSTFYEDKLAELGDKYEGLSTKVRRVLPELLRAQALSEYRQDRVKSAQNSLRLGLIQHESNLREVMTEGWAFDDLRRKQQALVEKRDEQERVKKLISKKKSAAQKQMSSLVDVHEEEELIKLRLANIRKEEQELQHSYDKLLYDRNLHIKELRRIEEENVSKFKNFPVLDKRYQLQKMIGKGGFSEVYLAFDLVQMCQVACKIQTLNSQWSVQKKQNYVRHAVRELKIHRALDHPRVVKLYHMFEIDDESFGIVLEYCPGNDLDQYLRLQPNKCLPEKEARSIMQQVFSGLKYFNQIQPPIIHYDLKPGNILLTDDGVKITDFGLSKIVEMDEGTGMELTSQGAGTFWYLPPEVFSTSSVVKISSKVDVWSAGIILYQLLYGVKPFGQDQSQQTILHENTIVKAYNVEFPSKPAISTECKEFIKRCLEYRQSVRPDVLTICEDPFLKNPRRVSPTQVI